MRVGGTRRTTGHGILTVIDDVMREVAGAERELLLRLETDIASLPAPVPDGSEWDAKRLERLEPQLSGRTDAERRLMALLAYARAERSDGADQAARLAERALHGDRLFGEGVGSPAVLAAGLVLGLAGRTEAAETLFGRVLNRARATSSYAVCSAASAQRGVERFRRGALAEAMEDLRAALDLARGQPWETIVDDGRAHLLRVHVERGDLEEAEQELLSWGANGPLPETAIGNRLLIERGRLRVAEGRFGDAIADLELVGGRLARRGDSVMFEWRRPAAMAHHRLGHLDDALELAHDDLKLAQSWGAPRQLGIACATVGLIEGGEQGVRRLNRAVEILQESSAHLEHGHALIALGAHLRRAGKTGKARAHLSSGLEIATGCGATLLAGHAEAEIAATGATRRPRTLLSGAEALTPSEQRVAHLAATGLSNPDIARALVVTRKTVEMHLGNAYRKLQIKSREQLGRALGLGETG
jgi:DNA-binding CsgD family transcriptional regulator